MARWFGGRRRVRGDEAEGLVREIVALDQPLIVLFGVMLWPTAIQLTGYLHHVLGLYSWISGSRPRALSRRYPVSWTIRKERSG